ncbi:hypothetical protein SIN01_21890 [Sporolactobacillus inulinus]|nr:hypothetical protein SIN01_21890 [Sporolactobacillus inulinus]
MIGAFISFITIPITTYFISPIEFGKASMFILFQIIFGTFLYLGIDQAYTREYHSGENKINLFQNAISIPLFLSIIVLLAILICPQITSKILFDSPNYVVPSIFFGIMIIFMVLERFILLSIRMKENALEFSVLNIIVKLTILIFTLIFIFYVRRDFLAIVYSTVFGQILGDLYLIVRYKKLFYLRYFSINKKLIKRMVLFGLPILVATSLSSLLNSLDRLSLRMWSDFYQIGIFTATLKIAAVLSIVQTSFTSFWVPTAYRWYAEEKNIAYYKVVSDSILLVMSVLAVGILIFKDLIVSILSSGYADSRYLIGFLCLQPIIYTVSETTCLGIVFSRKSYLSIFVGVIAIIPNTVLNILLVPKYGAIGAAIATSVSYVFFFAARTYFSNKSGMKFAVSKHYMVLLVLLVSAFINLVQTNMLLINLLILLVVLAIQYTSVNQIWRTYKGKRLMIK